MHGCVSGLEAEGTEGPCAVATAMSMSKAKRYAASEEQEGKCECESGKTQPDGTEAREETEEEECEDSDAGMVGLRVVLCVCTGAYGCADAVCEISVQTRRPAAGPGSGAGDGRCGGT